MTETNDSGCFWFDKYIIKIIKKALRITPEGFVSQKI